MRASLNVGLAIVLSAMIIGSPLKSDAFYLQLDDHRFTQCFRDHAMEWRRGQSSGGVIPQSARLYCQGNQGILEYRDQYGRVHRQTLQGTPFWYRCGDPCR